MGSPRQLLCCAKCGEFLQGGWHTPRKGFNILKPNAFFVCDDCFETLPE